MPRKAVVTQAGGVGAVAVAAGAYAAVGPMMMGPSHSVAQPSFVGYYDGHKDTYLSTDVSSKAEAKAMHVNYSARIGNVKGLPEISLVEGRSARARSPSSDRSQASPITRRSGPRRSSRGRPARSRS